MQTLNCFSPSSILRTIRTSTLGVPLRKADVISSLVLAIFASLIPEVHGKGDSKGQQWSNEFYLGGLVAILAVAAAILYSRQNRHETRIGGLETRTFRLEEIAEEIKVELSDLKSQLEALDGPRNLAVATFYRQASPDILKVFHFFRSYLTCVFTAACAIHSRKVQPTSDQVLEHLKTLLHSLDIPGTKLGLVAVSIANAYDQWKRKEEAEKIVNCFLHGEFNSEVAIKWISFKTTQELCKKINVKALKDEYVFDIVKAIVDVLIEDSSRFKSVLSRKTDEISWKIEKVIVGGPPQVFLAPCTPVPSGAFGKKMWEAYFGSIQEEEPPIPDNIYDKLDLPCPSRKGKIRDTHRLILVPKKVKLKSDIIFSTDVSLDNLPKFAANALKGPKIKNWNIRATDDICEVYEGDNITIQESHWILMGPGLSFPPASYLEHAESLRAVRKKTSIPYQIASALDTLVFMLVTMIQGENWPFKVDDYDTHYGVDPNGTFCQDFDNDNQLVIRFENGCPVIIANGYNSRFPCAIFWDLRTPA